MYAFVQGSVFKLWNLNHSMATPKKCKAGVFY